MKPYTLYKAGSLGFWIMAALMIHHSHDLPESVCVGFSFAFLLAHEVTKWLIGTVEKYDENLQKHKPLPLPIVR